MEIKVFLKYVLEGKLTTTTTELGPRYLTEI